MSIKINRKTSAANAFSTFQPDAGTSPVADNVSDTLTLTSSDASVTITGNSTTDTIDFVIASSPDQTLQAAYDASSDPEIVVDATRGALTIEDAATPIGANLLEVQSNGGGTSYLGVTTGGIKTVSGTDGAPSYSFIDDPDSGFHCDGANTVSIVTGGVEGIQIKSSSTPVGGYSNVGMGSVASTSDFYPLVLGRAQANPTYVQVSNANGGAAATSALVLKTDTGDVNSGILQVCPAATTTAALTDRFVLRSNGSVSGISIASGNASTADIEVYAGGLTASDRVAVFNPDISLDLDGGLSANVTTQTSATLTLDASHWTVLCDCTSNAITITLPAAASHTGRIYNVKKIDSTANAVTVDGNGSETIDGATTQTISIQYNSIMIQSDGSNWHIL